MFPGNWDNFLLSSSYSMVILYFAGYVVEKRSRGGDWVPVNTFPVKDTNFTVMGLQEGTVVEFRVAAVNDGGPGKFSKATPPHQVRDQVCKYLTDTIYSSLIIRNIFLKLFFRLKVYKSIMSCYN